MTLRRAVLTVFVAAALCCMALLMPFLLHDEAPPEVLVEERIVYRPVPAKEETFTLPIDASCQAAQEPAEALQESLMVAALEEEVARLQAIQAELNDPRLTDRELVMTGAEKAALKAIYDIEQPARTPLEMQSQGFQDAQRAQRYARAVAVFGEGRLHAMHAQCWEHWTQERLREWAGDPVPVSWFMDAPHRSRILGVFPGQRVREWMKANRPKESH